MSRRSRASISSRGQLFLDINSVSPAKKQSSCRAVEASGAELRRIRSDGAGAAVSAESADAAGGPARGRSGAAAHAASGFNAKAISSDIGVASAVKMCRSVIIKGIESLAVESMRAARHFGAEEQVLASLNQTFPGMGWDKDLPDYLISRVAEHGRRRAAEMREVARTLSDAGFEPTMADCHRYESGCAGRCDEGRRPGLRQERSVFLASAGGCARIERADRIRPWAIIATPLGAGLILGEIPAGAEARRARGHRRSHARQPVAAAAARSGHARDGRGDGEVLQVAPAADDSGSGAVLPRAQDGGGDLPRRRRSRDRPHRASPTRKSPKSRRSTTTC